MSTKVALITGAAQRIGAAIARKLHSNGYQIVIHYNHSIDAANDLALEFNQQRAGSAYCIQADLTDIAVIDRLVLKIIEKSSRLDVLINNASTFFPTPVGDITPSQVTNLFATNMIAPLFLSQACAPHLKQTNGCIINMCDIHGKKPLSSHTVYCMAKAGLAMMTLSLANELAPEVRVNAIAPGAIIWPSNGISAQDVSQVIASIPLGRKGQVSDITTTICYLLDSHYVTGQIIAVDGGRCISASAGA